MNRPALFAVVAVLTAACEPATSKPSGTMIGPCPAAVNGCNSFVDLTASMPATIRFGLPLGDVYQPACATVKVGQTIEFDGDFSMHPLSETCGPVNAIPHVAAGMTAAFNVATAGLYGYQCDVHGSIGMHGALQVVP